MSGKEYRGINKLLLTLAGYADPRFLTFKQAKRLGGHVSKGSKGHTVVYYKIIESKTKVAGDGTAERFPLLKVYTVFNVSQCEGLDLAPLETPRTVTAIESAEAIVRGYVDGPSIDWTSSAAFYRPSTDHIGLPPKASFLNDSLSYATLFHEIIHSTGHKSRLNRLSLNKEEAGFGSVVYGKEELVAELGASFLLGEAGLTPEFKRSASYLKSWIKVLKDDTRAIISAASAGQRAADYVLGRLKKEEL